MIWLQSHNNGVHLHLDELALCPFVVGLLRRSFLLNDDRNGGDWRGWSRDWRGWTTRGFLKLRCWQRCLSVRPVDRGCVGFLLQGVPKKLDYFHHFAGHTHCHHPKFRRKAPLSHLRRYVVLDNSKPWEQNISISRKFTPSGVPDKAPQIKSNQNGKPAERFPG